MVVDIAGATGSSNTGEKFAERVQVHPDEFR